MWDLDIVNQAWWFAANAHGAQKVPGSETPYISHVGNVLVEVIGALHVEELVVDPELAMQCAILHDVLEDTDVRPDQIEDQFGSAVLAGVQALTKNTKLPGKPRQMQDSLERIQQQPHEVWMVKMADRISNLRPPPPHWSSVKIQAYRAEAQMIHDYLHSSSPYLARRLARKIANYQVFGT